MLQKIKSIRALRQSKQFLKQALRLYRQKHKKLTPHAKERVESLIANLQTAIAQKNSHDATQASLHLEAAAQQFMPRSTWDRLRNGTLSLLCALMIALPIRLMWFEFYSIPTGSMRPTLKEGDYLVVSKTDFGINMPFRSGHFLFDPELALRGAIVVWTGENMGMPDDDAMYFYVIPGKKQYIKRLIGKPGDTLYFYGGKIYGVDREGREIAELREASYFQALEHIPFIRFEGRVETPNPTTAVLYQMNQEIAKLSMNSFGGVSGNLVAQEGHVAPAQYADFWGFKNYGMGRLLTKSQVEEMHPGALAGVEPGLLYLEIFHHPGVQGAKAKRDEMGRVRPALNVAVSLLPLNQEHLGRIAAHMTTCRFEVKDGKVYQFGSGYHNAGARPELPNVPDGVYEIQDGKASKVLLGSAPSWLPTLFWGGVTKALPKDHPLSQAAPEHIQTLYNFGFQWFNYYAPSPNAPLPSRYVYFRDGDLYLMGGAVLYKNDQALTAFLKNELQKQAISTSTRPYFPFQDQGPPDLATIKKYGITVPDKTYLLMGDNHAMSADSRQFGFVPQDNLRGGASFHFWPAGDRWGRHPQAVTKHLTAPNVTVLGIAAVAGALSYLWARRRRNSLP